MAHFEPRVTGNDATRGVADIEVLYRLGMMYVQGRDCEKDLVAAHKWLNIAAIRGSSAAARERAKLASNMTKAEIARALREARAWMTMH